MAVRRVVSSTWTHHNNIKFSFIKMRLLMRVFLSNWSINNHFIVILLGKRQEVNYLMLFLRELELCRLNSRNRLLRISHRLVDHFQVRGHNALATTATTHAFIWSVHLLLRGGPRHFARTLRIWALSHLHRWRWGQYFIKLLLLRLIVILKSFLLCLRRHLKYWTRIPLESQWIRCFVHKLARNMLLFLEIFKSLRCLNGCILWLINWQIIFLSPLGKCL